MSTTHRVKITTDEAAWIARALIAATVQKPQEAKHHAHFRVLPGGELVATTADGRRVHQIHLHLFEAPDPCEFTISIDALKWLKTAAAQFKADKDALVSPSVTITAEIPDGGPDPLNPGDVEICVREWDDPGAPQVRYESRLIDGQYPPYWTTVDELHDAEPGEPSRLPLGHLGAAAWLHHGQTLTPVIRFTTKPNGDPGPALLVFWDDETLRAEAVIIPKVEEVDA